MAQRPSESPSDELSTIGREPFVPILRGDEGQIDPIALSTWHDALSNTVSIEVPHDLMGIWLYPTQGGVVLLAPEALAADDLAIPVPSPQLRPEQLSLVEKIVLDAGYGSATCLPIRFGRRDVGLLLVADLQPDRYGESERVILQCVAHQIGPMLGRIARQWTPVDQETPGQQKRIAGLIDAVSRANRDAATPERFVAALSKGLIPLLPHDHLELLLPDTAGERYYRLGQHAGGPLWVDPSLVISRAHLDIAGIFASQNKLLLSDTYEDDRWPRGFLTASGGSGADVRGLVAATVDLGTNSPAYLLVGSIGPDLYGDEDADLLVLLAGVIAPQVGSFVLKDARPAPASAEPPTPEPPPPAAVPAAHTNGTSARHSPAEALSRISELLAASTDLSSATRLIAEKGADLLPFTRLTFALRVADGDRVVLLDAGERARFADLPLVRTAGTTLARVLNGEVPGALAQARGETRMMVPLRVGGRIHGALVFSAPSPDTLTESHLPLARQMADAVAAHLELFRRAALMPTPFVPGSRRG
jgi:GAF domain-containing protein